MDLSIAFYYAAIKRKKSAKKWRLRNVKKAKAEKKATDNASNGERKE